MIIQAYYRVETRRAFAFTVVTAVLISLFQTRPAEAAGRNESVWYYGKRAWWRRIAEEAFDRGGGVTMEWAFGKSVQKQHMEELDRMAAQFGKADRQRHEEIAGFRTHLREWATYKDVDDLIRRHLARIDNRLADISDRVLRQQADIVEHERLLRGLGQDVQMTKERTTQLDERVTGIESQVDKVRSVYLTVASSDQARLLCVDGMRLLRRGSPNEAARAFEAAHGFDQTEPGILFGLSLAYRRAGRQELAAMTLATAVSAERYRTPDVWFRTSLERLQGDDRNWLEERRRDLVYGSWVPGLVRAPLVSLRD